MDDLRKLQLVEKFILTYFASFCEENNLKYFLSAGTLLGAIRHNGFIPWDDDIDVSMPIEDYNRLMQLKNKLDPRFSLQTFETEANCHKSFAKLRLNGTKMDERHHIDYNNGIWLDIVPLIQIKNQKDYKIKFSLLSIAKILQIGNMVRNSKSDFTKKFGKGYVSFVLLLNRLPTRFRVWLHKLIFRYVSSGKDYKFVSEVWWNIEKIYPREIFNESTDVKFEDLMMKAPSKYHEYLEITYGDYMVLPPEEERKRHVASDIDYGNYEDVSNLRV